MSAGAAARRGQTGIPEQEGIKTLRHRRLALSLAKLVSLNKKGLRHDLAVEADQFDGQTGIPEQEGIKTSTVARRRYGAKANWYP